MDKYNAVMTTITVVLNGFIIGYSKYKKWSYEHDRHNRRCEKQKSTINSYRSDMSNESTLLEGSDEQPEIVSEETKNSVDNIQVNRL
jgi:hypothetical protein